MLKKKLHRQFLYYLPRDTSLAAQNLLIYEYSCAEFPSATVLILVINITSTPASNRLPVGFQCQLRRAAGQKVGVTTGGATVTFAAEWLHDDRQVEAIDKADVIVVDISEGKFGD